MIDLFLQTVLIGTATALLLNLRPYQRIIAFLRLDRKPFNCPTCLSVWTALLLFILYFNHPPAESIIAALAAGFIGDRVDNAINTI
jgi:hypothetical protein